jgi:ParB family chromosome partitioning protein
VAESADPAAPSAAHFALDLPTLDLADAIHRLPLDAIEPNPHQPRQTIEPAALQHLADSIRQDGVIQPIVVRPGPAAGRYTLVAGERRWRAARLAGLERIPALVRTLSDRDLAQWALVENLQREDLNPIERAQAFQHLIDRFNMSHEQVAEQVGVDRSTISNSLRLLNLCDNVQGWVIEGRLTAGHARALAGVVDLQRQMLLAQRVIREDWSVRKLEALLRQEAQAAAAPGANPPTSARANHLADLEQQIARQLGTKVRLRPGKKKGTGTLVIDFYSIEQFDSLMTRLNVSTE